MKYLELRNTFGKDAIIDVRDVITVLGPLDRRRLFEWQKKGYLQKITNNFYLLNDAVIDDTLLKLIANRIYSPSYIALESALSFYDLIPEAVFQIRSISSRKTKTFSTPVASFAYRSIHPHLFWGYTLQRFENSSFFISDPEKTILDYFYLNHHVNDKDSFEEMRFNRAELRHRLDLGKMSEYVSLFNHKRLNKTVHRFKEFINA